MKKCKKIISLLLVCSFLNELFAPTLLYALTTGPSQPETTAFEPIGTTDMVNLFTGDFTYNIPLLDVGGYPINLAYHSGVTMDAEASWCGLGWNINPGSISRNMRGIPDDFKGDIVTRDFNMKNNTTWGLDLGTGCEFYGMGLGLSGGVFKNNYTGIGTSVGINTSIGVGQGGKGSMTFGLGLNLSSTDGATASASVNYSRAQGADEDVQSTGGLGISGSVNTRTGLKNLTLDASYSYLNKSGLNGLPQSTGTSMGGTSSCTFSLGYPTFMPTIEMPLENSSFSFHASTGGEVYGVHPHMSFSGYFSEQKLASSKQQRPAYGYTNSQYGYNDYAAVLDFNREKDGPYEKGVQVLPIPAATFDLYSVNGQGIEGQYRSYRGDVGVFYDPINSITTNFNLSAGAEMGAGNIMHGGYDMIYSDVQTTTEKWQSRNKMLEYVNYQSPNGQNPDFEHSYFKNIAEPLLCDSDYQNSIGNSDLMKVDIRENDAYANRQFNKYTVTNGTLGNIELWSARKKNKREKRASLFTALTGYQATFAGVDKKIISHPVNDFDNIKTYPRSIHPIHHFSEISVLGKDGKRYVYGIPTYNNKQKEVTFSVAHPSSYPADGITTYSGTDNSTSNERGEEHYFNAQTMPAYATGYLLTGVLSADYVDVTGDGVTHDDFGDAYRFNYSLSDMKYHWRIPYEPKSSNYNDGFSSNHDDDKGSYLYGEKELWFPHSIESKNFVAQFILEKRNDGFGVSGEDGGVNLDDSLLRVKEIRLFSKLDLRMSASPVPIKVVHFEYDYSLCPDVDNHFGPPSPKGKLTLKKLWFTYGNNDRGRFNAYEFHYNSYNPPYDIKKYDRWGNFMDNENIDANYPKNVFFPYTYQQNDSTDKWSSAWNLTDIDLPSGGTISVTYESNDYAYVQNKKATQMFRIDRFGNTSNYPVADEELFNTSNLDANYYLFLKVSDTTTMSNNDEIKARYLDGMEQVYFKCLIDVDYGGHWDYVPGYVTVHEAGIPPNKNSSDGIIYLKLDYVTDGHLGQVNPIAKAAWQFIRINLPALAYPGSQNDGDWEGLVKSLKATVMSAKELFSRFDRRAQVNKWGSLVDCPKSWVRLLNPIGKKLGGGCRVKKLTLNDNWSTLTEGSGNSHEYGQNYIYTKTDDNKQIISSGVAAYEPTLGGDEIALRTPMPYETGPLLIPKTNKYVERPLGESLFPAPTIGYSQVTVSSIYHDDASPSKTGTGKTISEFYTAKDFPVITTYTDINTQHFVIPAILAIIGIGGQDYVTASQGFTVEVNNMHGKEKAVSAYDESGNVISSIRYKYKIDDNNQLDNHIDVVNADSSITTVQAGKDIDLWLDMRQQQTDIISPGVNFNLESMLYGYWPVLVTPIIPKYSHEKTRFRSAATVKFIQRSGILDEVKKTDLESKVTTKYLLFDSETGEPLLTKTTNEFDDPEFEFTYPAHWAYNGTGPAYKNIQAKIPSVNVSGGIITGGTFTPENYLTDGDELLIVGSNVTFTPIRAWVNKLSGGSVRLIDINGKPISIPTHFAGYPYKVNLLVIRSGRQNMASLPLGQVILNRYNPINSTSDVLDLTGNTTNTKITQATAREYNDSWKKSCYEITDIDCDTTYDAPLDYECLEIFWNNIIKYDTTHAQSLLTASYNDTLTVGSILTMYGSGYACDTALFNSMHYYSLSDPLTAVTPYMLALGDSCFVNITSLLPDGETVKLSTIDSYIYMPDSGCVTLCQKEYDDSTLTTFHLNEVAQACISCMTCGPICRPNAEEGDTINPFVQNMTNNWHQYKDWVYYTKRKPANNNTSKNRDDGNFIKFNQFWKYNPTTGKIENNAADDNSWTNANKVTLINRTGADVENQDALSKYTSVLYTINSTQPKALADNSPLKDLANDNFEDYDYFNQLSIPCAYEHWDFQDCLDTSEVFISDEEAHSGIYSLKVKSGFVASVTRPIINYEDGPVTDHAGNAIVIRKGCMNFFSPDSGYYIFSCWVKEDSCCNPLNYVNNTVGISYTGSALTYTLQPSGKIIEGWQRYYAEFRVPPSATAITVILNATHNNSYFDDIRIHPINSNMKANVFNGNSLRLMAQLDENNFAIFYEYDDQGILIRQKRETEDGIITMFESRNSYVKN